MKLKYSIKVFLESRVAPEHKDIDLKSLSKEGREKYYIQENVPIKLTFSYDGKRLEQLVGYRINRSDWDKNESKVKRNCHNKDGISFSIINKRINELTSTLEDIYTKARANNQNLSVSQLRNLLKAELNEDTSSIKGNNLLDRYKQFIEAKKSEVSNGYYRQLNSNRNHIKKCFGNKNIDMNDIDYQFLERFKNYYLEKNSHNSFAGALKKFKYFLNYAFDNGWINNQEYKKYTFTEKYHNKPIFLTWDEILILYKQEIKEDYIARVRDIFIFQSMIGSRYDDMIHLTKHNVSTVKIKDTTTGKNKDIKVLKYIASKSKTPIEVPLNKIALDIIEKYSDKSPNILPFISNQNYNEYIKDAGRKAELNRVVETIDDKGVRSQSKIMDLLSSHMARRNFIGNHINQFGTPEAIIKSMTGHSKDSKSFARYYEVDTVAKYRAIQTMV